MKIKLLDENATVPTYGTEDAAGADLYSASLEQIFINPGKTVFIKTGIAMEIPKGYVGLIFARSSVATKRGLAPANKVGVLDADYRGEVMVALYNQSDKVQVVEPKERIAQLSIVPFIQTSFEVVDSLETTERGTGGFGSTGTK